MTIHTRLAVCPALVALLSSALIVVTVAVGPAAAEDVKITEYSTGITPDSHPDDITVARDGHLWFTEPDANQVGGINQFGFVAEFPAPAGAEPTAIVAGDEGSVWFVESGPDRIGRMDTFNGQMVEYATGLTAGAGIKDIALGVEGRVWFTELTGNRIGTISPTNTNILEYAVPTLGSEPNNIAVGSDGRMWFTERHGDRIGAITDGGTIQEYRIADGSLPGDITAGPDGKLWFSTSTGISSITTVGTVDSFPVTGEVDDLAFGIDGNLWFTGGAAGQVGAMTPSGSVTWYEDLMADDAQPQGITSGPGGDLWVVQRNLSQVARIATELGVPEFENTTPMVLNDAASNTAPAGATPYPSTLSVSGLAHRRVTGVTLQLTNLDHTWLPDLDAILVGPTGTGATAMSDIGSNGSSARGVSLRFSATAATRLLPGSGAPASGQYLPTNLAGGDIFPPGAPPGGPFTESFGVFVGTNPEGTWSLYISDDAHFDSGMLHGGWGLDLMTEEVPAPVLTSTNPASPSSENSIGVFGTSEAGSTVRLYGDSVCTVELASGTAAQLASPGIQITVPANSTTTLYSTSTDGQGNVSACSTSTLTYVEDSLPPGLPTFTTTSPPSPANNNTPKVKGAAEQDSTVRLYDSSLCPLASTPLATGSAGAFAAPGLAISVADNTTTALYASATDAAGNVSGCSTSTLSYEEKTPPRPQTTITQAPAKKIKTTKKKVKVTFKFTSSVVGSTFTCSIDDKAFRACTPGYSFKAKLGKHLFSVRATAAGLIDATPAAYSFKVKKKPKNPPRARVTTL